MVIEYFERLNQACRHPATREVAIDELVRIAAGEAREERWYR